MRWWWWWCDLTSQYDWRAIYHSTVSVAAIHDHRYHHCSRCCCAAFFLPRHQLSRCALWLSDLQERQSTLKRKGCFHWRQRKKTRCRPPPKTTSHVDTRPLVVTCFETRHYRFHQRRLQNASKYLERRTDPVNKDKEDRQGGPRKRHQHHEERPT